MSDLGLKLPIIRENLSKPRPLSMDEYYEFVQFNLKHVANKKTDIKWKKMAAVDIPFSIK